MNRMPSTERTASRVGAILDAKFTRGTPWTLSPRIPVFSDWQ